MRLKIMGLCLVAVFALTAAITASASATEPGWYECHKLTSKPYTGKYTDKKCSKEATAEEKAAGKKNKYELQEGVGKGKVFKGSSKGAATLHTPAVGGEVTCTSFKDEGKAALPNKVEKVVSTFSGCTSLGKSCTSGAKKGTIVTHPLDGELGYINKGAKEVGVDLKAEGAGDLADFECEGLVIETSGSVIGRQTGDINVFSKTSSNVFQVNGEGFQEIKKFEGGPTDVLESKINGSGPFESGQQASATNKGEELEVKA